MNKKKERISIILGIIGIAICALLMWDIDRFLGVVLLVALIAMVGMYVAVCIEPHNEDESNYLE